MRIPSWLLLILVFVVAALTVGAALFAYGSVRQFASDAPIALPTLGSFGDVVRSTPTILALAATPSTAAPIASDAAPQPTAASNPVLAATPTAPTLVALSDPLRVTILLMGIDQRKGEKGPFHTDTMIVLSIDPARKTAVILSIPRDIFIQIPGYGPNRINTAEGTGESNDYPGGGSWLAVKTVENLIGVPIQHFFLINFDVFTAAINAVAPITVCPPTPIHDTSYPDGSYGVITVDFPAGCQPLDATKLLQYARVRHNAGDDFGRAQRQQEVIKAVRDKVLSLGGMSSLITQVGSLWNTVKDSVKTDMTFDQMVQLGLTAQGIPKENIVNSVLTDKGGYLLDVTRPNGDEVLSPIYERIHELIGKLFNAPPGSGATPTPAAADSANEGTATILVSNGAGVDGLGKQTVEKLRAQGFTLGDAKNADLPGGYSQTVIRVYTGKIKTARTLAAVLGLDGSVITSATGGPAGVDIEVIVGKDLIGSLTKTP